MVRSCRVWNVRVVKGITACIFSMALWAQEEASVLQTLGPRELIAQGQQAFQARSYAEAAHFFGLFLDDYGEAEEVAELKTLLEPMIAVCFIQSQRFEEALPWVETVLARTDLHPKLADELGYWLGVIHLAREDWVQAQHAFGRYWANEANNEAKRFEALLQFGQLYLVQGFPEDAAEFFAAQRSVWSTAQPEVMGRAGVLEIAAHMEAENWQKAYTVAFALHDQAEREPEQISQWIMLQQQTLQLGQHWFEEGDWEQAIVCLRAVRPQEQVLDQQRSWMQRYEKELEEYQGSRDFQALMTQRKMRLQRMRAEVVRFEQQPEFDLAVRLRLAQSYLQSGRDMQGAILLERAFRAAEPGSLVDAAVPSLLQTWSRLGWHDRVIELAEVFKRTRSVEAEVMPLVMFVHADTLRQSDRLEEAQIAYEELVEAFPDAATADQSMFMQGFIYLLLDDQEGARFQFAQLLKQYPETALADEVDYWTGMADYFAGDYGTAREHFRGYPERWPQGGYGREAQFRVATATFSLGEYEQAIPLLVEFSDQGDADELTAEALVLLGDALIGQGKVEEALQSYQRVAISNERFFEEAYFKRVKVMRLSDRTDEMRALLQGFVENFSASSRLPEAVYWLGWIDQEAGDIAAARDRYWRVIREFANDADRTTLVSLLSALPKLYPTDAERDLLRSELQTGIREAFDRDETHAAIRYGWGLAQLKGGSKTQAGQLELAGMIRAVSPRYHEPEIAMDVIRSVVALQNVATAEKLVRELRRWHPRTVYRGELHFLLGELERDQGQLTEARGHFEKSARFSLAPVDVARAELALAQLLAERDPETAIAKITTVLETPKLSAPIKVAGLMELGRIHESIGRYRQATAFYERVYVSYGGFLEETTEAYWRRGQLLEKLQVGELALQVYQEAIARSDLAGLPFYPDILKRSMALKGGSE